MENLFGSGVLLVAATFFVLTTLSASRDPAKFAASLGLAITNPGGRNEVRSQYAAFFGVAALACLAALLGLLPRHSAYLVLLVIFGGLFAGRLVGLALNGGVSGYCPVIRALHVIDGLGFALAIAALLREPN